MEETPQMITSEPDDERVLASIATAPSGASTSADTHGGSTASAPRGKPGCGSVVLGLLTVLVGIPMLVCPGPGVAVILAGLGMIAVGLGIRTKAGR